MPLRGGGPELFTRGHEGIFWVGAMFHNLLGSSDYRSAYLSQTSVDAFKTQAISLYTNLVSKDSKQILNSSSMTCMLKFLKEGIMISATYSEMNPKK